MKNILKHFETFENNLKHFKTYQNVTQRHSEQILLEKRHQ